MWRGQGATRPQVCGNESEVNMEDYSSNLLNAQLKTIFEMLQILIANMEIKDGSNALGYDFSHAEPLFDD